MCDERATILIIDDVPENIHELSRALASEYEIIFSTCGEKGIKLAVERVPDIILLDVVMPSMGGYEVCNILKSNEITADIPIIFITARDDPESEAKGLEIGAADFLTKPVNPVIVRARVKIHITRRRHEQELVRLKNLAEEANMTKSRFLAIMSHELRTPLNPILGFSEILRSRTHCKGDSTLCREYAGMIHDAGAHLLLLVNDILDISAIEMDKVDLECHGFDIGKVISTTLNLISSAAHGKQINLTYKAPPCITIVYADMRRVRQVLMNILANAIKYSHSNSTITISCTRSNDGRLEVVISDNGVGVAQQDISRLMIPFTRLGDPLKYTQEGIGLGLYISKRLMELHGGSIHIDSILGSGTDVTLSFPPERVIDHRTEESEIIDQGSVGVTD